MKKKLMIIIAVVILVIVVVVTALCVAYIPRLGEYSGKSMKIRSVDDNHYIELPLKVSRASYGDNIYQFKSNKSLADIVIMINNLLDNDYSYKVNEVESFQLYKISQFKNEKEVATYYLGKTKCSCGKLFFANFNYLDYIGDSK